MPNAIPISAEELAKLRADQARYYAVRNMLILEQLSSYFRNYKWPSGSDKNVSKAEFDNAIDRAMSAPYISDEQHERVKIEELNTDRGGM